MDLTSPSAPANTAGAKTSIGHPLPHDVGCAGDAQSVATDACTLGADPLGRSAHTAEKAAAVSKDDSILSGTENCPDDAADGYACNRQTPATTMAHAFDAHMWASVLGSARSKGCTGSDPLVECGSTHAPTYRNDTTHAVDPVAAPSPDRATPMILVLQTFVTTVIETDDETALNDCMATCRGPALALVCTLRAILYAHVSGSTVPGLAILERARLALASAVDSPMAARRNVIAYLLGLLTSVTRACEGTADSRGNDLPLQAIVAILGNSGDPARSVLLQGLDMTGADDEDDAVDPIDNNDNGSNDDIDNSRHAKHPTLLPAADPQLVQAQDDLLTRLDNHHPDLFMAILCRVDPWGIRSLALTSRAHYVLVVKTLREDDAKGRHRRLAAMALSGTVWLQRYGDSRRYEPVAHVITPPPFDRGPLPSLRPLLFLCRSMVAVEADSDALHLRSMNRLAVACALGCGGAVARYLEWINCDSRCDGWEKRRQESRHIERLAYQAGVHMSATMMQIAVTETVRWTFQREWPQARLMSWLQRSAVQSLVDDVVSGIMRGLARPCSKRRHRSLADLAALVEVLSTFLAAVRRNMDGYGRWSEQVFVNLRMALCRAALLVLAPGMSLPMPLVRTRLALALCETAWTAP
ncbi:hypothetical protein pqer_cds_631 [Pandoravirus quercus]|uniref:DUF5867 domain-containing protein n=1 Tax=Pandoravirus quercus TaxID=2107709 RepID=A0A2U7U9D2_9VIRU|nr:hypothetical protein pqer_cds_631 [Pandoravirus quercus]AVK75053.1 hypothetical protein pqer_cds_631 [Pandoravirus quercus]